MVATDTPSKVHTVQTLDIKKHTQIAAPPEIVWDTLFQPIGPMAAMNIKIEPFPGGRWYRDLGNNNGHLWGHVQVIKAPTLIEVSGPMFMSYPAMNPMQYKLKAKRNATRLNVKHKSFVLIRYNDRVWIGSDLAHI